MDIEASPGETAYEVLNRGIEAAKETVKTVKVTHNDVTVSVYPQSFIHDVCDKYDLAARLKRVIQYSKGANYKH